MKCVDCNIELKESGYLPSITTPIWIYSNIINCGCTYLLLCLLPQNNICGSQGNNNDN